MAERAHTIIGSSSFPAVMKKAVVLLSGGIDSATTLAIAKEQGFIPYALTFAYGQRHRCEIEAAKQIAHDLAARRHVVMEIDLRSFGGSALTDDIEVPKDRSLDASDIPVTYVPARNTIFLSFALAWAEVLDAEDIFIGVNALDYSGYPDCRPEYVQAFEAMARLATRSGVLNEQRLIIHTPLIRMTKAEIITKGHALGVDFGLTWSCYEPAPDGRACGLCDSCALRLKGFKEAGLTDPLLYAAK